MIPEETVCGDVWHPPDWGFPPSRGRVNERCTQWAWFKCTNQHLSKDEPWLLSSSMSVGLIKHFLCIPCASDAGIKEEGGSVRMGLVSHCWLAVASAWPASAAHTWLAGVQLHSACQHVSEPLAPTSSSFVTHDQQKQRGSENCRSRPIQTPKETDLLPFNAAEVYQ